MSKMLDIYKYHLTKDDFRKIHNKYECHRCSSAIKKALKKSACCKKPGGIPGLTKWGSCAGNDYKVKG